MIINKYFLLALILFVIYKLKYPVLNKDNEVKYPDIKVSLVGKEFTRDKLIMYCANKMIDKGYEKDEVEKFVRQALAKANKERLLNFLYDCFYIY